MKWILLAIALAASLSAQDLSGFTPYQQSQVRKFASFNEGDLSVSQYLECRTILTDLASSNPVATRQLTKAMLGEVEFCKKSPEYLPLFDIDTEFNLCLVFAVLTIKNGGSSSEIEMADLKGRMLSITDRLKNQESTASLGSLFSKVTELNNAVKPSR